MIIEQHYDDEVLISLLEQSSETAVRDPHIASCSTCTSNLDAIRQVTSALHDETVWDRRELSEEPRPATREALRTFASSSAAEDAEAEPRVKALLAKSRDEWRAMVEQNPGWGTAGFVRKLIGAVDSINFTSPTDAVELTKIAVDVAESLTGMSDRLAKMRASAWREYAYALFYVGSYADSLHALDRVEECLEDCAVADYERARARLYRADVSNMTEKLDEAVRYYREARQAFVVFGDHRRRLIAELGEGTILMRASRFAEALAIQLRTVNDPVADEVIRACALQNAAMCCRELGHLAEAKRLFAQAINSFERLGDVTRRASARWQFGRALLAEAQFVPALEIFSAVRSDFQELGMAHDLAQSSVDAAEALLMLGRTDDVVDLCKSSIDYFRTAELTYTRGALTALAYLREAAHSKSLTLAKISDVRVFFTRLPKQPELLFAPPA